MFARWPLPCVVMVLCAASCWNAAAPALGVTYYVRKSGNDSNIGTQADQAWQTIDRARRSMVAGDRVYVGAGIYEETIQPRIPGTSATPIQYIADRTGSITGDAGEVVIAPQNNWSVILDSALYTRFDGFTFRSNTGYNYGIYANKGDGFTLQNCRIENVYYGAYLLTTQATISACVFDKVLYYPILSYYRDLTITDTVVSECGYYAVFHYAPPDVQRYKLRITNSQLLQNYTGPYAYYSDLVLNNTIIRGNRQWGAVVAYGDLTIAGANKAITNNGYGLYLAGNGTRTSRVLRNVDLSSNGAYAIYATDCNLALNTCKVENTGSWAVALVYASLSTSATPIQNNGSGVLVYSLNTQRLPRLSNLQVLNNRGVGIYHYSYPTGPATLTLNRCTVRGNTSYGLLSYYGDVTCSASKFAGNTYGLYLSRDVNYGGIGTHRFTTSIVQDIKWHGLYATAANVVLNTCEFRNCTNYGVLCYDGSLSVSTCVFDQLGTSSGYALMNSAKGPVTKSSPKFTLRNSTITNCYGGPYADNTHLTIDTCTIEKNKYWGIAVNNGELVVPAKQRVLTNNGYGLYLAGNPPSGPRRLVGWNVSGNGDYGIYAADCKLRLTDCKVENMKGWAMALSNAALTTVRSPIRNNGQGVLIYSLGTAQAPSITNAEITDNRGIAIYHSSNKANPNKLTVTNCTVRNNQSYSLLSYHGDVTIDKSLFETNTYGLYLYRTDPNPLPGAYAIRDSVIRGINWHGVYAPGGAMTMERCQIENCTNYGLLSYYDSLTVRDCVFDQVGKSSGYAVYHSDPEPDPAKRGKVYLQNSILRNSYAGVYADKSDLTIDNCTIEGNKYWALVSNYGQLDVLNQAKAIHNNGYGVYVAGNTSPEGRVLDGWDVSNNGNYGIYATDCDLVLNDCKIEGMQGWGAAVVYGTLRAKNSPIRKSGHGLVVYSDSAKHATELYDVEVDQNTGYGIYHSSNYLAPSRLKMERCKVQNGGSYSLLSYYGNVDCADCTFENNASGLYLYRQPQYGGIGQHVLKNTNVRNITQWHGIYATYGRLDLQNCRVESCRNYGVLSYYADVNASDCVFTGCTNGYAVYLTDNQADPNARARMNLKNCQITGNYGGPYVDKTNLVLDNCTIENNTYWALVCNYGEFEFKNQAKAIHKNGYGLYVAGNLADNRRVLQGFDVSDNGAYGVYGAYCNLVLEDCKIENMASWGAAISYGTLRTANSPIRNNGHGLLVYSQAAYNSAELTDLEITGNTGYGIYHSSSTSAPAKMVLRNCNVKSNGSYALLSYYGDVDCQNTVFDQNRSGLYLYRHPAYGTGRHQLTDTVVSNTTGWHGIYAPYAALTMLRCRVENSNNYGVLSYYDDFTAEDCVFSGNGISSGYGVYHYDDDPDRTKWAKLSLKNCDISNNYGGPYSYHTHMTIDNCTIQNNRYWAISCNYGDLKFVNQAKAINGNGYGLYIAGNDTAEGRVLKDFDVSKNGNYGVYGVDCDLVLENCKVQDMQGWGLGLNNATLKATNSPILNNGHGIYISSQAGQREPVVTGIYVGNSGGYGVYHYSNPTTPSKLTMRQCSVDGYSTYGLVNLYGTLDLSDSLVRGNRQRSDNGVYSYLAPQMNLERVSVVNHRNWGVLSYGNNALIRNSVISNNNYGAYLYNYSGANTAANVWNSTFANNSVYGLVQYLGRCSLINCIVSTEASGNSGLYVDRGTMSHSYNLVYGYSRPFVGTAQAEGELLNDPRFANAAVGDYTLKSSSSAINSGRDMVGLVDTDMVGIIRPMFGKWEMGAYEYPKPTNSARPVEWKEVR